MEKNIKTNYMDPMLEVISLDIRDVITSSQDPYETEDDIF